MRVLQNPNFLLTKRFTNRQLQNKKLLWHDQTWPFRNERSQFDTHPENKNSCWRDQTIFLNIWIDAIWWQVVCTMTVYLQEEHKNVIHQRYTTNTTLNYKFHLFKGSVRVPFVVEYLFLQWPPITFMLLCTLRSYLFNAKEAPKTWIVQHWPPPTPGHLWHNILRTYTIWEYILMHIFHWK